MDDRSFDKGRRATLAAMAAGTAGLLLPSASHASAWGTIPATAGTVWATPPDLRVLEIHLYGGLSMWETFYVRAPSATSRFRGFESEMAALPFAGCDAGFTDPAPSPFANDANGRPIHLGPATKPLWKPQILDKMRIVALSHEFQPHEAAIPLTMTGQRLGNPKLAGLGAAIQHHFVARDMEAGPPPPRPYSYVLWPESFNFPNDNLQASAAIGMHPAFSRPLVLKVGPSLPGFLSSLTRTGIRNERDALLHQYVDQYSAALRHPAMTASAPAGRTRSKGFAAFESSSSMVFGATSLNGLLAAPASPASQPLPNDADCPNAFADASFENMPGHAIKLAAYLLAQTGANAPRYVCVIDKGLKSAPAGGGYDTHSSQHVEHTNVNLFNICKTLRQLVDAGTLNLANTMVVLTTEFGRTPLRSGGGRDHWPEGFCQVLIGGPVTRGVSGALLDGNFAGVAAGDDGRADPANHFKPPDLRAAILTACGIMPFENEAYAVPDISFSTAASSHGDLMRGLKTRVLGA
ncbi:MAG TPA: DUF1501 domain-containing protein [Albitalea sp.]|nr:DUF1501 domain-containing protein [Albitalea sp.]HJW12413.1 DUF1501 domain-containing protein [Albitalea sp.]